MQSEDTAQRSSTNLWMQVLVIGGVAAVISILAGIYTRPGVVRFDEKYYLALAKGIAGGVYDDGYIVRPPLYPLFFALMLKVFGSGFTPTVIVQGLIRGVLVGQITYMGGRYFSALTGIIAGAVITVFPLIIWVYTRFLNEVLYLPLFMLSLYMLERAVRTEQPRHAAIAGIVSGLASLARVTSFFFTIIIAIWFLMRKSRSGRFSRRNTLNAALLVGCLLLTISPWTIRNAVVHKGFIPLGNEAAFNLYFTVGGVSVNEATAQWDSWGGQVERQREALRRWREYVLEHPSHHFRRLVKHMPRVFDPGDHGFATGLSVICNEVACRQNRTIDNMLKVAIPATLFFSMIGGLVGIAVVRDDPARRQLFLFAALYFILIHTATVMKARYFLPAVCVLSIYAARLVIAAFRRRRPTSSRSLQ
jgi:4-amino-4-deoxy-L-arabinose transferase-like glycosyltransferase